MEMIIVQKRAEWKGRERNVREGKEREEGKGKGGRERKGRKGKECEEGKGRGRNMRKGKEYEEGEGI